MRNFGATTPYFAAMEYYALILNRTFKVFIADKMLCAAFVRGLTASPMVSSTDENGQKYWVQTLTATLYEQLDVTSKAFKKLDFFNFQIPWRDVGRIEYDPTPKWGMGNVPHSGKIKVRLKSGRTRELILLGQQDGFALKRQIEEIMNAPSRLLKNR